MPTLQGLPFAMPKGKTAEAGTAADWCAKLKQPAWLHAAIAALHPVNKTFTEAEFTAEARRVSGFQLGR